MPTPPCNITRECPHPLLILQGNGVLPHRKIILEMRNRGIGVQSPNFVASLYAPRTATLAAQRYEQRYEQRFYQRFSRAALLPHPSPHALTPPTVARTHRLAQMTPEIVDYFSSFPATRAARHRPAPSTRARPNPTAGAGSTYKRQ